MTSTLKACPFCGRRDLAVEHLGDDERPFFLVTCRNCEADGPVKGTTEQAVEAWNSRVQGDGN